MTTPSLTGLYFWCVHELVFSVYHSHRKKYNEHKVSDPKNILQLRASGSFHFYFCEQHKPYHRLGSFYIVVNPELQVRRNDSKKPQILSLNAIQCQTILSKCMGPIDTWKDKLKVRQILFRNVVFMLFL